MKIKQIVLAILAFSLMAPTVIASASATDYFPPLIVGEDNLYTANDMIWLIDIKLGAHGEALTFNGQDIIKESLTYEYSLEGSEDFLTLTVTPKKVSLTDSQVKIWWDSAELQAWKDGLQGAVIAHTRVIGTIAGGDTFLATGPGFAYCFRIH